MKRGGKIAVCLAGGLAFVAGVCAADSALPNNPYASIVVRNIFNINPPAPVDPTKANAEPPPKITPNGIMSIFGRFQVLFKAAVPPKSGQPAKEQSYILSEGQRQDDIEVTKIDEKASLVTFNNHGTIQELPLASTSASGPSGLAQIAPVPAPNFPAPTVAPNGNPGGFSRFGNRFGQGGSPGANFGAASRGGGGVSQQSQNSMTPEAQMITIAALHAKAQQEGDPTAILYPPTSIDAAAGVVP